ncbi:MAG TPA: phospholipase D-like domain-containing protein [Candidatus Eremiobacteraceae bacterium]|nr:phospholipase D-like domain-containing protein [Candidatus Eremiobacteraceae bacterium]
MNRLSITTGDDARTALCEAIGRACDSVDAELYSLDDPAVTQALNAAASRGVRVRVVIEGDVHRFERPARHEPSDARVRGGLCAGVDVIVSRRPNPLVHAKAAVIDDAVALFGTGNMRSSGFRAPGEVLVTDDDRTDVDAVEAKIAAAADGVAVRSPLRAALAAMLASDRPARIASEDLSDPRIVRALRDRALRGVRDRILVGPHQSKTARRAIVSLLAAGADVRVPRHGYMHEKFVDAGDRIYVGSANLTFDGLDEANEVGIVAPADEFGSDAARLRDDFDGMWADAVPPHFHT